MAEIEMRQDRFPAVSKEAAGPVNGVPTEFTSMTFSDKIMVTISQGGRLAQWVSADSWRNRDDGNWEMSKLTHSTQIQVPISPATAASGDLPLPVFTSSSLPSTHLTPKTLLGGGSEERETVGQLFASQIASFITLRNPEERRTLLLGLGLEKLESSSEGFFDIIELVQQVL